MTVPFEEQHLFFDEKPLNDKQSLRDYGIQKGSTLILKQGIRMQIRVETATKEVLTLDVVSFETIETIKERIEEAKGIPTEELHLFFQGKKLQDNRNLEHYDIEHQSTLLLKIGKSMTIFV